VQSFAIDVCERNLAREVMAEMKKKPEDVYREDMFRAAKMSDAAAEKFLDKKYDDAELAKFMKHHGLKAIKKNRKLDRRAAMDGILLKLPEVRARI